MGVAYLAREMFDRIARNTGFIADDQQRIETVIAAILHDIGHAPFSHTFEDVLRSLKIRFNHEHMTVRMICDSESRVHRILSNIDGQFPREVAAYIDKSLRRETYWRHKIVSSQIDADRLDYIVRDVYHAGLSGYSFDLPRILDMLVRIDDSHFGVSIKALEAVEAFLIALDQTYRAVYYHHTNRAANSLLSSIIRRAATLVANGDKHVLRADVRSSCALLDLITNGESVDIENYTTLNENVIWTLISGWQTHDDAVLADLSVRLLTRRLPKTLDFQPQAFAKATDWLETAKELTIKSIPAATAETVDYYVTTDESSRTSYKLYDWMSEAPDEQILIVDSNKKAQPIENINEARIIGALKDARYTNRIIFPSEIRKEFVKSVMEDGS